MTGRGGVGTLNESNLHRRVVEWFVRPGDQTEVKVGQYVIDVVRGLLLVEVQTKNFSSLKVKLARLTQEHQVLLIYPLVREKWIKRTTKDGTLVSRRKSPRKNSPPALFNELVNIPDLLTRPTFAIEVLVVKAEVWWVDDGKGSRRRKGWSVRDTQLLEVEERIPIATPRDLLSLAPVPREPFTSADLSQTLLQPKKLVQRMLYCYNRMGLVEEVGKKGRFKLYKKVGS